MHVLRTTVAALSTALMAATAGLTPAIAAVTPYEFDPRRDVPPEVGEIDPGIPMEQKTQCATSAVIPDSQFDTIPIQQVLAVEKLHDYATGKGQKVAVIDSGVAPNVRLPHLEGLGDFVANDGDGLDDCDHHGTLIAGIIAAGPARNDSFIGMAPDATIMSVRQTSSAFEPADFQDDPPSSINTLARSVRLAADKGATVINMSVTACYPAEQPADLRELAGALNYAANERDVVLVASAGNVNQECKANPAPDDSEGRGWESATTISVPSIFDEFVLSVGGTTLSGDPYANTLPGPWVDVSAPAVNVVSLDPTHGEQGGLINAEVTQNGAQPLAGTSFAAAYVSGLAALVREKYPEMTAREVRERIVSTSTQGAVGARYVFGEGRVNPMSALTQETSGGSGELRQEFEAEARQDPAPLSGVKVVPLLVAGLLAAVVVFTAVGIVLRRKTSDIVDKGAPSSRGEDM